MFEGPGAGKEHHNLGLFHRILLSFLFCFDFVFRFSFFLSFSFVFWLGFLARC